jgi:CBS domain containing-hemolysin-like protein
MEVVTRTDYSRFPVSNKGNAFEIIGFIHAKDLFQIVADRHTADLRKILRKPAFVSADEKIDSQLRRFQRTRFHQAVVLDQRDEVTGLVTLEDIIEELVGSIRDEHD